MMTSELSCVSRDFLESGVHLVFQDHRDLWSASDSSLEDIRSTAFISLMIQITFFDTLVFLFRERLELRVSVDHQAHL